MCLFKNFLMPQKSQRMVFVGGFYVLFDGSKVTTHGFFLWDMSSHRRSMGS